MTTSTSVRIPAGKLGTVRVDRTVDVYSTSLINNETISKAKTYIPKLTLQCQLSETPTTFIIKYPDTKRCYVTIKRSFDPTSFSDEDKSDIAVIYSVVRHSSTRRTSSPKLSALPLPIDLNISEPYSSTSYTLEPPSIPIVTNVSKEAQIKTLSSNSSTSNSVLISTSSSLQINSSSRLQTSTSFSSSDRPSAPLIAIKSRPCSFRSPGRNALERQISNITERVSQLQETFFSRLSSPSNLQQNNSLSIFSSTLTDTNINDSSTSNTSLNKPRPKSETYDDHHRAN
ncbi:unnamed protein product, partial [Rotaria sp. Silwood2]